MKPENLVYQDYLLIQFLNWFDLFFIKIEFYMFKRGRKLFKLDN